jgi:hypothetical protein
MSEQEHDRFWNEDLAVGEGNFHGEASTLRLKLHYGWERYSRTAGPEIVPLSRPRGERLYFLARPYILVPDVRLTIALYPYPAPGDRGAIGEVRSSQWRGMRHLEIGSGQAWYYPNEATLILWEVLLHRPYRQASPAADRNLQVIWTGFERALLERCAAVERVATPHDEPEYEREHEREQWQAFLRAQGYRPLTRAAFAREVARTP